MACTLVEDGEGTQSLVCSCVGLAGCLVVLPCWGAAVGTAADSGTFTSSFWAGDKPAWPRSSLELTYLA